MGPTSKSFLLSIVFFPRAVPSDGAEVLVISASSTLYLFDGSSFYFFFLLTTTTIMIIISITREAAAAMIINIRRSFSSVLEFPESDAGPPTPIFGSS